MGLIPLCSFTQEFYGQRYTDSLEHIINAPGKPEAKAMACFYLFDKWLDADSVKAGKYLKLGEKLSSNDPFVHTVAGYYKAREISNRLPDAAIQLFYTTEKKLEADTSNESLAYRSKCWREYAKLFHLNKDDPETYLNTLLNNAIPLAQRAGDSLYLGKLYTDVGIAFKNLQNFPKAIEYLKQAITLLEKTGNSFPCLASAYHTLSESYSLSLEPKPAEQLLQKMYNLLQPYPDDPAWLDYYAGRSMQLTVAEQFDSSLAAANKGILLAGKLKRVYPGQRLLLQKFYALYNKNEFKKATDVGLQLTRSKPFVDIFANRILIYNALALTYAQLKDSGNAYLWLRKYSALSDSLAKSNLEAKVSALEVKFRNAENQKKITALNAANIKATLDARNSRLWNAMLGLSTAFLFITLVLGYLFYRNTKRTLAQKEAIKIAQAMVTAQEEERSRIARDLHDGLGSMLSGVKINLAAVADEQPATAVKTALMKATDQLGSSIQELRQISRNMMPEMLLKLGLETSLKDLCLLLQTPDLSIQCHCANIQPAIPPQKQVTVYRIVQELLTNAIKHAGARHVLLQCVQQATTLLITIEDDGKGFTHPLPENTGGIGWKNIQTRVAYLNGSIDVMNLPGGSGTSINIQLDVSS
ncbi:hypothetical protein A8C56_17275 [Niabella ginsenosidivorans]|uniref:Histidine kinase domain-containing protein n=2 Tax=Niabella ginsenosidivorans TaxID=1176587 RepID=A0A1A9I482_9BACT|nr:hypothetical protein A8C56_17275 [Niabella ginsenosidivorans]